MIRRAQIWLASASVLMVMIAIACFYRGFELGIMGEEGYRYNPDVATHPAFLQMQDVGDQWIYGGELLVFCAAGTGLSALAISFLAFRNGKLARQSSSSSGDGITP